MEGQGWKNWKADLLERIDGLQGFVLGLNLALSEEQQLRAVLEEMEFTLQPPRERLAEITEAHDGNGH